MKNWILTAVLALSTGALAEGHQGEPQPKPPAHSEKGHSDKEKGHDHKDEHKKGEHHEKHKEDDHHKHDDHKEDKHDDHKDKEGKHHDEEGDDHDHEHVVRLIVSDGEHHTLRVLDAHTGKEEASFSTPGKISGLYTGPSGFYAYGVHRNDNRVTVLHSGLGLEDHGDHQDLIKKPPYVISTLNTGKKPTHFFKKKDQIVIFNDGDGTAAVFGEALLGISNDIKFLKSKKPDHAAPALIGKNLLLGMMKQNHIEVYDVKSGKQFKTVEGCDRVHGETVYKDTVYFGCTGGVLAVNVKGRLVNSSKILNPANTPEKTRVGKIVSNEKSKYVFGNFGQGLAYWAPGAKKLSVLKLPDSPMNFKFTEDGKKLIVLTVNGQLHSLDVASLKITKSVATVAPYNKDSKKRLFSTMVIGEEHAYVTNPTAGEVLKVSLDGLKIKKRFKVAGAPMLITLTEAEGVSH